jgi:hypothetical protein
MITAAEAAALRDDQPTRVLRRVYNRVESTARAGETEVVMQGVIPAGAKTELEGIGYTVATGGTGTFTVSW